MPDYTEEPKATPAPPKLGTTPPEVSTDPIVSGSKRSPSLAKLAAALAKAQGDIVGATKDRENPHFKSGYASLASTWEACREPLSKNELAVLQPVAVDGVKVKITTLLVHSSGEWIEETLVMVAALNTPQGIGSAITYGRRYGLGAMVGVAPEDDDGNEASTKLSANQRPAVQQSPTPSVAREPIAPAVQQQAKAAVQPLAAPRPPSAPSPGPVPNASAPPRPPGILNKPTTPAGS